MSGPALNVVVISEVQRSYAPAGRTLIAAAVPGSRALDPDLTERVRSSSLAGSTSARASSNRCGPT